MRSALFLLFFLPLSLWAHSLETEVSSDEARFEEGMLILQKEVKLSNQMGTLSAAYAELKSVKNKKGGKVSFDSLNVKGDIHIQLKEDGEVFCEALQGDLREGTLLFLGEKGICYVGEEGKVEAKSGTIYFDEKNEWKVSKVILEGAVKLSKESSFALADRLEYLPNERKIRLLSNKMPVLFFDKEKGITLSAKEVVASRAEIHGVGDVHFTLSDEQMKTLKEQFAWKEKAS